MNSHFKKAEDALHFSEYQSRGLTERQIDAAQAHAQATLALAYAQETANLIAVLTIDGPHLEAPDETFHEVYRPLVSELKERLGLA